MVRPDEYVWIHTTCRSWTSKSRSRKLWKKARLRTSTQHSALIPSTNKPWSDLSSKRGVFKQAFARFPRPPYSRDPTSTSHALERRPFFRPFGGPFSAVSTPIFTNQYYFTCGNFSRSSLKFHEFSLNFNENFINISQCLQFLEKNSLKFTKVY